MLTRDELVQKLMDDYAPEDKILGWVWGWDSVLEFLEEENSPEVAKKIWEKCYPEVDEAISFVMNSYHAEAIDEVISDAVTEELE